MTMTGAPRRRIGTYLGSPLLALLVAGAACSGGASVPPETEPAPPAEATVDAGAELLAALHQEAASYFEAGVRSYEQGQYRQARQQFEAALDVYLDAEAPPGYEGELQAAFNELFSRIHMIGLDELLPQETAVVDLADEYLPPPDEIDEEHLNRLRERLAESLPALPRWTLPLSDHYENPRVVAALQYLITDRREVIVEGLSRATRFMPMIERIFEEEGVPAELAWVPLIESLYKPTAFSRAAAAGMWQFMSGTARLLGLRVDYTVDERRDPVRATRAAARYLLDLHDKMDGDWELAIAAYNGGWGRVQRAARRAGISNFWELSASRRYLPRETREFVPKIYAAILIGTDPELYGLSFEPQEPYEYDEAIVDSQTMLTVLAEAAGTSVDVIRELNPHLRAVTPRTNRYLVRVPPGTKDTFEAALAAIPPEERVDFIQHQVRRGETLGEIAADYGTRVAAILEVNDIRNANRIREGQRLVIPVGAPVRTRSVQPVSGFEVGERTIYTVQRGDSLHQIAQVFRTNVRNLMEWNDLHSSLIFPGDTLIVHYGVTGNQPVTPTSTPVTAAAVAEEPSGPATPETNTDPTRTLYTVRRGDSLYLIAQRLDVTVEQLKRWNNRRSNTIYPGDKLVVYTENPLYDADRAAGAATTTLRYAVRRGDSPYTIAQRYGISTDSLLVANNLNARSKIYPGDELLIPGGRIDVRTYTVKRGDSPARIAQLHRVSLERLLQVNGLTRSSKIYPGDQLIIPGR